MQFPKKGSPKVFYIGQPLKHFIDKNAPRDQIIGFATDNQDKCQYFNNEYQKLKESADHALLQEYPCSVMDYIKNLVIDNGSTKEELFEAGIRFDRL